MLNFMTENLKSDGSHRAVTNAPKLGIKFHLYALEC